MKTREKATVKKPVTRKSPAVSKKETATAKETTPKVKLIDIDELAKLVGVTTRRITQLEDEEVIKSEPKTNNKEKRQYKFAETIIAIVRYYREKADSRRSGDSEDMAAAKLQNQIQKNEKEDLLLQELRGDLHRTADIERVVGAALSRLRINLLATPMGVAPLLREKKNVNEIAEIINDRICRALNEIATFDIDKLLSEEKNLDEGLEQE